MGDGLKIGQAAKATGLSIDAIRFYQRTGLLKPPARTSAGYRMFTAAEIANLEFIAKAQDLGFSLAEIKELAALRGSNGRACEEVRALITRKRKDITEKIAALKSLENELRRAERSCDRVLQDRGAQGACPVIDQITRGTRSLKK